MQAFAVTKDVRVSTKTFVRKYLPTKSVETVEVERLILSVPGEAKAVLEELAKDESSTQTEKKTNGSAYFSVSEENLHRWPFMPRRLGRYSIGFSSEKKLLHQEGDCLYSQCKVIKEKCSGKKHFRVALINAFGNNLGDNLVGLTALRHAIATMLKVFPFVAVDILCGPIAHKFVEQIFRGEPYVGEVSWLGPTIQDFSKYDGYFDFSNLINEPRYSEMPAVDWCIWWLGLDPNAIPVNEKRNKKRFDLAAWAVSGEYIARHKSVKVFFSHRASVPLRTFPQEQAVEFVRDVLKHNGDILIICDQHLPVKHPRFLDLSSKKLPMDQFESLVAQCDALITVDTYISHLADVSGTPTVLLCSSVPAARYPYYPFTKVMEIPGASTLEAYGKPKVSDDVWKDIQPQYTDAWAKLKPAQVVKELRVLLNGSALKASSTHGFEFHVPKTGIGHTDIDASGIHRLKYAKSNTSSEWVTKRLSGIVSGVCRFGSKIVIVGANTDTWMLAEKSTNCTYEVFEPRRALINVLKANFSHVGVDSVIVRDVIPCSRAEPLSVESLDPWSEFEAGQWGNTRKKIAYPCLSHSMEFVDDCDVLVVQPPMPIIEVMATAMDVIRKVKPILIIAPINKTILSKIVGPLKSCGYNLWAEVVPGSDSNYLFLAVDENRDISITGFIKIEIS